ncbi:MAG: pyridoxal phosphate-dependent aminotransferase [Betaproteobacteria bacterium]|nr:pyridoxal phosphate-dependent aminotransferase [Betaproteobacteria bacterium]
MTTNITPLAQRVNDIEPFHVMELLARARALEAEGRSIVHMEIGEPDFPTPRPVCDAGIRALEQGELFYTPALGLPALREKISGYYRTRYGVDVPPSRIIVTSGSSGALLLAIAVLVDPGREVLMADPGYPCNRHFVRLMEGKAVAVPVGPDSNYQLNPELLERHWSARTSAVLVATPANPTGTLIPLGEIGAMAKLASARGGALIVDEIYHGLTYSGDAATALALSDDVFVINSFSKYFNMTGWRLGWMVVPERYVREIDKVSQNVYLSAPTPSQYAALAAFEPRTLQILETRRAEFKARRDYLVPALRALGFEIPGMPQGAFYIYAGCSAFTPDSFAFAHELLEQAGVAITPGVDFGAHAAERHVRFAYTNSIERLKDGVARLEKFLKRAT